MAGKQIQPPSDVRYRVIIDGQCFNDPISIPFGYGTRNATMPEDRVYHREMNGRRESIIVTQGGIYPVKPKCPDWQPYYDGDEFVTCIIETIDEWPNPCACCGASHDTLDCD